MKPIEYSEELAAAINAYHQAGGVVQYVSFKLAEMSVPDYESTNRVAHDHIYNGRFAGALINNGHNGATNAKISLAQLIDQGYAKAFSQPPYPLKLSRSDLIRTFETINQHLIGDAVQDLEIRSWSTDWSHCFDAGNEWWGAHWWTIYNSQRNEVTVITASTTN